MHVFRFARNPSEHFKQPEKYRVSRILRRHPKNTDLLSRLNADKSAL